MSDSDDDAPPVAGQGPPTRRRSRWRLLVPAVMAAAGLLFATSGLNADGDDLRPDSTDLGGLVKERTERVASMRRDATDLRREIDDLSAGVDTKEVSKERKQSAKLEQPAGFTRVSGSGMRLTLTDAPRDVDVPGLDPNLLVVHQQDIQAFVNAMWAAGATAVTLQGQRLISTTGIKCVGNTVVLDGVPYAPPYVIEAVGNQSEMEIQLAASEAVQSYKQYVDKYDLGLKTEAVNNLIAPAYEGSVDLEHATPKDD